MPFYSFSTPDGKIEERFFRMGEAPRSIILDSGKIAERDFAADHAPRRAGGGWPIVCYASGVHESQAQQLRDFYQKHGESVDVTSDGDPVYTSASQRKRLLRLRGMHDRASFN